MAVATLLLLPPPKEGSPTEPTCYGSPAKAVAKKEVRQVSTLSLQETLLQSQSHLNQDDLDEVEEEERDDEEYGIQTTKKSYYWTKEVEEKLGLGGADPYGLLQLEDKRWRATPEEIRKSYRRLVLTLHPDKKDTKKASGARQNADGETDELGVTASPADNSTREGGGEESEGEEDADFKLLSAAWELLGNTEQRRAFDSVDYINDYLPERHRPKPEKPDHFFRNFGPPFTRQSKFSIDQPVPQLGDANTPYEEVARFYRFWQNFRSWREFTLLTEHDLTQAEDREERRWMMRNNKNQCARIKKDEAARLGNFVALAYESDPRIQMHREQVQRAKEQQKAARDAALRAEREQQNAEAEARAVAEREQQAAVEAERQIHAEERAASKREKEKARSALKKARKELRTLGEEERWKASGDFELLAASLNLDQLRELVALMSNGDENVARTAVKSAVQQVLNSTH
eukprot:CAMPEP_0119313106 /NCGR_PEP_ID=MMETSP1333-20130426/27898_1 /TAXON_ID=418940 /ORGANISM="Scyphosphaera apsteinii, Strain RCC1455" /LENGTH=460 /DNA_ID=CAMNT_0007317855 /DNA_START=29 /DNA_END=1411 /DNA_ORIENTATION=+